jgi:hypothetical protein
MFLYHYNQSARFWGKSGFKQRGPKREQRGDAERGGKKGMQKGWCAGIRKTAKVNDMFFFLGVRFCIVFRCCCFFVGDS